MKKFVLSELMLLSVTEKKAIKVKFHPKRTLIFGKNGTGKSSLIKSIYKTFGANSYKDHPIWKALNPISFVRFTVDGIVYSILKEGKLFAIFDQQDNLIDIFQSVTNELGPFLAKLFDFKVLLPNQKGEIITPPPAFLFLPYYIDQDISWQKSWSSFGSLQQIKNFREPIASYHTGLRPNEYYETKGEIEKYEGVIRDLESERKVLKSILVKVKEQIAEYSFNIDIEIFKEEIRQLLIEFDFLKTIQEDLKSKLVNFYNIKISLESQATITKSALNETRKDYKYATEIVVDDFVDCPTCGAHYENSFVERFEIAKDEERCKELLIELSQELKEIDEKIQLENAKYTKNIEEIFRIERLLESKKGDIKLKDVIDSSGRNEINAVFQNNLEILNTEIHSNALDLRKLQNILKALGDKDRRAEIMNLFYKKMKEFLRELDVNTLKEENFKKIEANIPETGSALPRALIAYYFSLFQVMRKYTSSTFCPIVIDSPNQQAQDLGHIDKILKFIDRNQPEDSQLILGIEELYDVNFNCEIIELTTEKSLLKHDEYQIVHSELDKYLTQVWNHKKIGRLF